MPAKVDDKKVDRKLGHIYIGIGGWNFEPWRGVFYPKGLPQAKELEYAASHLTSIEINATFYGSQKPESFRKWAATVPNGFVFSVKGPRFATNRRVLAEAGNSIKRFLDTGVLELGDRLGPLLWQFAPTKKFDPADFGKFLELLPAKAGNTALRHVVEVRHPSFCAPDFVALARELSYPDRVHRSRAVSVVRRRDRRFHLRAPAKRPGHDTDRLSAQGVGRLGQTLGALGAGQVARRLAARRRRKRIEDSRTARRVCLCHSRRESTGTPRSNGFNREDRNRKSVNIRGYVLTVRQLGEVHRHQSYQTRSPASFCFWRSSASRLLSVVGYSSVTRS